MEKITKTDIFDMVEHWLETPVEAYLGSGYGSDLKALLQNPQNADGGAADAVLSKLRADVSVLTVLPRGSVNLYGASEGYDRMRVVLEIAGDSIELKGQ